MINLILNEISLKSRTGGAYVLAIAFYAISISIIPIITTTSGKVLSQVSPGLFWIISTFAVLLAIPNMVQEDIEDGSIQQLRLVPYSSGTIYLAKWITTIILVGLPIIVCTGFTGLIYNFSEAKTLSIIATQAIGLPGVISMSITLAIMTTLSKSTNSLSPILILPMVLPVFIFSTTAIDAIEMGYSGLSHIYLLAASSLVLTVIAIFSGTYILDEVMA